MKRPRKQLFVDSKVQGAIIKRVVIYWVACLLFITLPIVLAMTVNEPNVYWFQHIPTVLYQYWPVYLVMFILLPCLVRDALNVSNRFCGPVSRLLRGLKEFNETGEFNEIRFRDNDYWQPMAVAINEAMQKAGAGTSSVQGTVARSEKSA